MHVCCQVQDVIVMFSWQHRAGKGFFLMKMLENVAVPLLYVHACSEDEYR